MRCVLLFPSVLQAANEVCFSAEALGVQLRAAVRSGPSHSPAQITNLLASDISDLCTAVRLVYGSNTHVQLPTAVQRDDSAAAQADAPAAISRPLGRFLRLSLRLIVRRIPNRIPPSRARNAAAAVDRRAGGESRLLRLVHFRSAREAAPRHARRRRRRRTLNYR